MKVAFLFSGQVREIPISLFKQSMLNLTKNLDYSIYAYVWQESGKSLNHSKSNHDKIINLNTIDYLNELFRDYNLKSLKIDSFESFKKNLEPKYKKIYNSDNYHFGTINSMPQIYILSKCYDLIKDHLKDYDLIFKCRFDSLYIHPLNFYNLKQIESSNKVYNLNFGRAYYPARIYDVFFGGSPKAMSFLSNIWNDLPNLVEDQFNNKLDKRDACRLLYLAANLTEIEVDTFETRICDVFRNFKNNYYEKYLLSMHLIKLSKLFENILVIPYLYKWFIFRKFKIEKVIFYLLRSFIISPISYMKRLKYLKIISKKNFFFKSK